MERCPVSQHCLTCVVSCCLVAGAVAAWGSSHLLARTLSGPLIALKMAAACMCKPAWIPVSAFALSQSLPTPMQVYKGRRKFTGQITAMKFIMKHGKSEKDIRNLRQEIEILQGLRHENIIQMLDSFETKTDFCVVMEFAHGMIHGLLITRGEAWALHFQLQS